MKDYKVIRVKFNMFNANSVSERVEELLNKHSRSGWSFEQLETGQMGVFLVLSKPKAY